ncbi:Quinolinate phosphoribosyl transferase [Tirmania nivea]|nr:Quinolinate phosphoribosyl transferase [Tirmania nivea]
MDTFGIEQFLKYFKHERTGTGLTYTEIYTGSRQDSGDSEGFVEIMKAFYTDLVKETGRKTIAEKNGFATSFGVGTFLTNDFKYLSRPNRKSTPLNIMIKLSSTAGQPAIKISDNIGKNTSDKKTVEEVKRELGYIVYRKNLVE